MEEVKSVDNIIKVLMIRDGYSMKEAIARYKEAKYKILDALICTSCLDHDHVFDFI